MHGVFGNKDAEANLVARLQAEVVERRFGDFEPADVAPLAVDDDEHLLAVLTEVPAPPGGVAVAGRSLYSPRLLKYPSSCPLTAKWMSLG